ncbi:UDP-2,3-diacylglucosamine diphosphatase [candidate division KSB1 bacterium]|nr:UDP-2,3-diacylglucosamine diphosphatase [candidate division KSB1 bacterium]
MAAYYLFSDAHLGAPHIPNEPERKEKILAFLEYVKTAGKGLFIVGDLFDSWFEYRHAIPNRHFAIFAKLYELRQNGVEIDYLAGNHEWPGDYLRHEIGVQIHHEGISRELCGHQCFITHGDGTAKPDVGYRLLKRIIKHPVNIFLYQLLSPDLGIPLASFMSRASRKAQQQEEKWPEEYRAYAAAKLAEGYEIVLMGHTHYPKCERVAGKTFINLGDWMTHFTYCKIDAAGPRLLAWPERGD